MPFVGRVELCVRARFIKSQAAPIVYLSTYHLPTYLPKKVGQLNVNYREKYENYVKNMCQGFRYGYFTTQTVVYAVHLLLLLADGYTKNFKFN